MDFLGFPVVCFLILFVSTFYYVCPLKSPTIHKQNTQQLTLTYCFVRFPGDPGCPGGIPGSPRVSSQKVQGMLERVREGWRRSEKVGGGQRRLEKVGEGWRKCEKV